MTDLSSKQVLVSGRVQGVSYRAWTQRAARRRGVKGWVRNMPDGTVLAHLEGPENAVRGLINDLRSGPSLASVTDIKQTPAPPEEAESFEVIG